MLMLYAGSLRYANPGLVLYMPFYKWHKKYEQMANLEFDSLKWVDQLSGCDKNLVHASSFTCEYFEESMSTIHVPTLLIRTTTHGDDEGMDIILRLVPALGNLDVE